MSRRSMPLLAAVVLLGGEARAARPVCGDGRVQGAEQCDGASLNGNTCSSLGFSGGTLACSSTCVLDTSGCSADPVCGDGVAEGVEECDGADATACPGLCSAACACPATGSGDLEIHVIDVGQGDALLVVSPDGFAMLVDAGNAGDGAGVAAYLAAQGLGDLDYTLVSHLHSDHLGGMDEVLGAFPGVVACWDNGGTYATTEYADYDAAAGSRRATLASGDTPDLGPSVTATVLHANAGSTNENLNSVVVRVEYGSLAFLLGGDCEGDCEATLAVTETEVYKVHHHGSDDSSTADFLSALDPWTALVSVGDPNAYGHPGVLALARLADAQATVYRTDVSGDLVVLSNGTTYTVNGAPVCSGTDTRTCGTTDVGACSFGTRACSGGMWGACTGAVAPVAEDCANGLDDDCDGATDAADPSCATSASHVLIVQVAYDTPGTDSVEEFVDLYNPTASDVPVGGWTLADGASSWTIPAGTSVPAGGYLSIARDDAGFQALHAMLPDVDGMTLSLNNDGDVLVLSDGAEVDRVTWEAYAAGWTVSAPTGDAIVRSVHDADTDANADWTVLSPASPFGGVVSACGDGTCSTGEDCTTCAADCPGVTSGKASSRYCCGNGTCEAVGETATTCAVDCGP